MIARRFLLWFLAMALSGCASYGVVRNDLLGAAPAEQAYSLKNWNTGTRVNDLNVTLAFSGGGTRAAAFSYGVLKALRDTVVTIDGRPVRLLDEIDTITSVSGGSFTAAYYGLYGERIFTDFEPDFLRRDVEQALLDSLFNPLNWFRSSGRTERAIEYYEEHLFHGATFADMRQENRPLVVISRSCRSTSGCCARTCRPSRWRGRWPRRRRCRWCSIRWSWPIIRSADPHRPGGWPRCAVARRATRGR